MLCTAPYYVGTEDPQGGTFPENDSSRVDAWNQLVRAAVARHPGVVLFDLNGLVSPGGRFASTVDGVVVRSSDGVHFGPGAGAVVGPTLFAAIRDAALGPGTLKTTMSRGPS
jgi:hypothetical protein